MLTTDIKEHVMALSAFSLPGRFFRGNLHTHSNLSDGCLEPSEVCRRYKAEGYDFISLTDHFIGEYGLRTVIAMRCISIRSYHCDEGENQSAVAPEQIGHWDLCLPRTYPVTADCMSLRGVG